MGRPCTNDMLSETVAWYDRVAKDLGKAFHEVGVEEYKEWVEKGFKVSEVEFLDLPKEEEERLLKLQTGSALRKGSKRRCVESSQVFRTREGYVDQHDTQKYLSVRYQPKKCLRSGRKIPDHLMECTICTQRAISVGNRSCHSPFLNHRVTHHLQSIRTKSL